MSGGEWNGTYCFALGCSRSGTTALTRLLHAHPEVVMGMERYKLLLGRDPSEVSPALFSPGRFLDFREGDTNITPRMERFRPHYESADARLRSGTVRCIGDKIPAQPRILATIVQQFPRARFVFIYRDLLHVASSFCVRASNPADQWPSHVTHEAAHEQWTRAFAVADRLSIDLGDDRVFVVRYERLFSGDTSVCESLVRFLGVEMTDTVRAHFAAATANWHDHESKPLVLTAEQIEYLTAREDRSVVDRFDHRFERQLVSTAG